MPGAISRASGLWPGTRAMLVFVAAPRGLRINCMQQSRGLFLLSRIAPGKPLLSPYSFGQVASTRTFGRGKKIVLFGHAKTKVSWRLNAIFFMTGFVFFLPLINWGFLERRFGMKEPHFIAWLSRSENRKLGDDEPFNTELMVAPSNPQFELRTKQTDVHEFLTEKAMERYDQKVELVERAGRTNVEKNVEFLKMLKERSSVKAKEVVQSIGEMNLSGNDEAQVQGDVGFRNRKIIEYENRIRQYSTPDKIFRYFATYKVTDEKGHSEVMMTPEDFLRSISPGMRQPEHLGLDQYISVSNDGVANLSVGVKKSSIFYQFGAGGLISFSDYLFLLTVLSTSRRHFEIAFKMFDLNGDGNVDAREFEAVTNLMKSQSSVGARHRDHSNTGSTFKGVNSGLIHYFFGHEKEAMLTVDKFLSFQRHLQNEILALEFKRKLEQSPAQKEVISERDFADLLIAYAGFPSKKKARMLKRVRKSFSSKKASCENAFQGISLEDFLNFYQVLYSINDIDTALTFYHIAGAPIERETMQHVAKTVAGVELSEHVVNVVFVLFDENGDGKLSNREFISVMKQRAMRGLEKPKDTGIGKIFAAFTKCAGDSREVIRQ